MKKAVFLIWTVLLCFPVGTVWAASFLTVQDTSLYITPDSGAKILLKARPGWLLHASPAEKTGWYAVSEFQKTTGSGFTAVHLACPESDGYAYVAEKDLMPVPQQGEGIFPAEDPYTPPCDSEGLVPIGVGNIRLPLGNNSLQKAADFDFGAVFIAADAHGTAGDRPLSFSVLSIDKDRVNPWKYNVDVEVRTDDRLVRMNGTFTLKKAADFVQNGMGMKAATGNTNINSVLHETPNGFVSADADLHERGGTAALQGILTAYFLYETHPLSKELLVALNDIPEQEENPNYRNLFFTGTWRNAAGAAPALGGSDPLKDFPDVDGKLLEMQDYADSEGDKVVILTHSDVYPADSMPGQEEAFGYNADVFAYGFVNVHSGKPQRLWMMRDHVRRCETSVTAEFAESSPVITDLDEDGVSEVWIVYYIGCRGDVSPEGMKIHLFDGIRRFSMLGETLIRTPDGETGGSYTMDPPFAQWPEAFREFAVELWADSRVR